MKKILRAILFLIFIPFLHIPLSHALPAEDVQPVTDAHYFQTAQKIIRDSKESIRLILFEMAFYDEYPNTPSNLLIKELIEAKRRGVRVEVILEVREGEDRTTKRNRRTGKILSEGGVDVIYDSLSKTTHAKLMIVDGSLTLVGSTNWTYAALTDNHEVNVLIRSKDIAKDMIDYFNRVKSAGIKTR